MATKADMIAELEAKGVQLTGKETAEELKALLDQNADPADGASGSDEDPEKAELQARLAALEAENAALKKADKPVAKPAQRNEAKEAAEFQNTADKMKAELAKQPKVGVFIPLEQGEPKGTQLPVEINGYRINVPKGQPNVQVPQAVAEIIWQSLGVYDEASSALRSQNDPDRPLRLDLQSESDKAALNA